MMIMRHNRELKLEEDRRKMETMKKWNQEILRTNQRKMAEERRVKESQRQTVEECTRTQEEVKKQKQLEEKRLKELHRQKLEEFRKSQEKVKEERDKKILEYERHKKEILKKKQEEATKLREEERMRREFRRKFIQDQKDQDEQKRIDEEIDRWRREENNRRSKEAHMKVPMQDQLKLECQRQRVEEVIIMSSEMALKGSERSRMGAKDSTNSEDGYAIPKPIRKHGGESDEETSKENLQNEQYILERSQQEQEEESRREAQQARYKRYQEERQCKTLEDDLQKLIQKAYALATLVDDAGSVGTLDELDSRESYEGRRETDNCMRDKSMRDRRRVGCARKDVPLCADQYEGMTYLYNRLEEEEKKQLLSKKPKARKSKAKKQQLSLPKNCGRPYTKSLSNKPARGVLEPIPFLKFDGSPCFGHGLGRRYVIRG